MNKVKCMVKNSKENSEISAKIVKGCEKLLSEYVNVIETSHRSGFDMYCQNFYDSNYDVVKTSIVDNEEAWLTFLLNFMIWLNHEREVGRKKANSYGSQYCGYEADAYGSSLLKRDFINKHLTNIQSLITYKMMIITEIDDDSVPFDVSKSSERIITEPYPELSQLVSQFKKATSFCEKKTAILSVLQKIDGLITPQYYDTHDNLKYLIHKKDEFIRWGEKINAIRHFESSSSNATEREKEYWNNLHELKEDSKNDFLDGVLQFTITFYGWHKSKK